MNKLKLPIIVMSFMLIFSFQSQASEPQSQPSSFINNVSNGFANMTTGVVEIPKNVINISNDSNFLAGISLGLLRGVVHTVSRTVVGVAELLSSPFVDEELTKPGCVWERLSEDTRYFDMHYPFYWTHFGPMDDGEKLRLE